MCKERGNVFKVKFHGGKKVNKQKAGEKKKPTIRIEERTSKKPHERRVVHFAGMGCLKPLGRIETGISVTQWEEREINIYMGDFPGGNRMSPGPTAPIKNVPCLGKVCTVFFGCALWGNGGRFGFARSTVYDDPEEFSPLPNIFSLWVYFSLSCAYSSVCF